MDDNRRSQVPIQILTEVSVDVTQNGSTDTAAHASDLEFQRSLVLDSLNLDSSWEKGSDSETHFARDSDVDFGGPAAPPDGGLAAWLQVAGGFFIFFNTWGVIMMYGVFQAYYQTKLLPHESPSNISWIGALQGFLLNTVCVAAGPIYDAGYMRSLLFAGTCLSVVGMMMTSLCTTYWQLLLAQGVAVGTGSGLLFLPSIAIVPQYFSSHKALATGLTSLGSSVGGIVYPIVFRQLQPHIGFGWAIRTVAFIMLATSIVSLVLMRTRVPASGRRKLFDWAAFKDMPYAFFLVSTFFGFMGIFVVLFYIQLYAQQQISTNSDLAFYMLSILNAGSFFGCIIPNFMGDHFGLLNTHIICVFLAGGLAFCWIAINNMTCLSVFSASYGFFFGPFVSLSPPIVASLTSDMNIFGTRLGMFLGVSGLGLLAGNPIAGVILRGDPSWLGLQIWAGAPIMIAAIFLTLARVSKTGPRLIAKA